MMQIESVTCCKIIDRVRWGNLVIAIHNVRRIIKSKNHKRYNVECRGKCDQNGSNLRG